MIIAATGGPKEVLCKLGSNTIDMFLGYQYLKLRRTISWGTAFRSYSEPLRTLNGELVLIVPLWGPNVPRTSAVFNGILQGSPLYAAALMIPQLIVLLLQMKNSYADTQKTFLLCARWLNFTT